MYKFFGHLKTVIIHKYWVGRLCFYCGLYKQGVLHDMSKFSPTEFWESVKYWSGVRSPIDACKEENGVSFAWQHHKGRNPHHCEYWCDNFDTNFTCHKMPWKYALELICDYVGAGIAYNGGIKNFNMTEEYKWWLNKKKTLKINEETSRLVNYMFERFVMFGVKETLKDKKLLRNLRKLYE